MIKNDISLRDEFNDLFDRDGLSLSYVPYIARLISIDGENKPIKCYCWNSMRGEGAAGCPNCDGVGHIWTEHIIPGHLHFITTTDPLRDLRAHIAGRQDRYESGFITKSDINLKESDRIYVPNLTEEGAFLFPISMKEQYIVVTVRQYRLEDGRIEFVKAYVQREK